MIKVTVWNETSRDTDEVLAVYPEGINGFIAQFLSQEEDFEVRTANQDEPDNGLPEEILADTDVLIWWAHRFHGGVSDETAFRVVSHVQRGMGFIPLHSAHLAKPFRYLMGTSCNLKWRDNDFERVWTINPTHPIAAGIPEHFELEKEEMYGERFDIPTPDDIIFMGWFSGGEVFRSGCVWQRGMGKVFYFQPGHETNHSYHNEYVQRIIKNGVRWAQPVMRLQELNSPHHIPSLEELRQNKSQH